MKKGRAVGVIIARRSWKWFFRKRYLVLYRLVNPIGIAFPAGHVEEKERIIKALWREVYEETGMTILWPEVVFAGFIPGDCPKCEGGGHDWTVYEAKGIGSPKHMEPSKHAFVKFMSRRKMKRHVKEGDFDPAWFNHILPALGIIPRALF